MAFGTDLQGRNSHESLLSLQDAEIHLLETIKKCIAQKAKCDRDYVSALSSVLSVARKQEVLQFDTPVSQTWKLILNEIESLIHLISQNSDKLCASTVESFLQIITEKKALRKAYADERAHLDQNLTQLQNMVAKFQIEYDWRREKVNQNRNKFDDLCRKHKNSAKLDDVKAKYISSESKLHNIHNDYVIALQEANVFQQHYTCVMLPSLLSLQQVKQESFIQQSKEALLEFATLTDCSSAAFNHIYVNINNAVEAINPTAEYHDFVSQHRSDPVVCVSLKFCDKLLNGYSSSLLQSNEITLNDLTSDNIKRKQKVYYDELERIQQQILSRKSELENLEAQVSGSETQLSSACTYSLRVDQLKHEILEQNCIEEKVASVIKLLGEPMDMLGSDPPPLALPDIHMTTDAEGSSLGSRDAPVDSAFASVQQSFVQFKTMAKRLTRRPRGSGIPPPSAYGEDSTAIHHDYVTSEVQGEIRTLPDGSSAPDVADQSGVTGSVLHASNATSEHQHCLLDEEEWFHGVLPRDEVQRLLVNDGDFLVRASKNRKTDETQYVLSIMWCTHKHFIIQECENGWRFEGDTFPTVHELIMQQYSSQQPVTRKSEAVLKQAISRPDWELRNDDIELYQKIGSGQFGEVFRGSFRSTEVAVKTCRETLNDDVKRKFLQEGRILKQYDHPNIVRFIGIASQRHPVMIVMEYVSGGSLLSFLRRHGSSQSLAVIIKLAVDASAGMAYLEERSCLHRDLAARNCLVDSELSVKISDFGMSREEQEYVVSGGLKQIPIKWTAPEALNYGTYTSACDVWSFGVLLWEIYSFGAQPYPGLTNSQAREKVDEGYRMPPPENTPDDVYQMMMHCWEQDPKKRPCFREIHCELQHFHGTLQ